MGLWTVCLGSESGNRWGKRSQFYVGEWLVLREDMGQKQWEACVRKAVKAACQSVLHLNSLCSPSVLDRLNALLEPGGVLTVSERGMIDGSTPTITPHPNFRYVCLLSFCLRIWQPLKQRLTFGRPFLGIILTHPVISMFTHSLIQLTKYLLRPCSLPCSGDTVVNERYKSCSGLVVKGRSRETSYKPFAVVQGGDNHSLY